MLATCWRCLLPISAMATLHFAFPRILSRQTVNCLYCFGMACGALALSPLGSPDLGTGVLSLSLMYTAFFRLPAVTLATHTSVVVICNAISFVLLCLRAFSEGFLIENRSASIATALWVEGLSCVVVVLISSSLRQLGNTRNFFVVMFRGWSQLEQILDIWKSGLWVTEVWTCLRHLNFLRLLSFPMRGKHWEALQHIACITSRSKLSLVLPLPCSAWHAMPFWNSMKTFASLNIHQSWLQFCSGIVQELHSKLRGESEQW